MLGDFREWVGPIGILARVFFDGAAERATMKGSIAYFTLRQLLGRAGWAGCERRFRSARIGPEAKKAVLISSVAQFFGDGQLSLRTCLFTFIRGMTTMAEDSPLNVSSALPTRPFRLRFGATHVASRSVAQRSAVRSSFRKSVTSVASAISDRKRGPYRLNWFVAEGAVKKKKATIGKDESGKVGENFGRSDYRLGTFFLYFSSDSLRLGLAERSRRLISRFGGSTEKERKKSE